MRNQQITGTVKKKQIGDGFEVLTDAVLATFPGSRSEAHFDSGRYKDAVPPFSTKESTGVLGLISAQADP